jgi:dynein heavy chain
LDLALPILEAAKDAVKRIDKNMINEMKSFKAPPTLVGIVMNAVCLLFGEKEDWDSAKKVLGRMTFLSDLLDFNTDNVPDRRLAKLKQTYLSNPDFTKEKVAAVSQAATCLLTWVIATEKFAMVKKIVGPKEKALKEAEAKLREVETQLAVKQSALKEVQDMVSDLKRNLDNSIRRSEILRQQQETAKV